MSLKITRRPRARLDLIEIWSYIADDNEAAADRLLRRIDEALLMLANTPLAGRARPELGPDIRSFPIGNYILFYAVQPNAIDVVRVLSRYRDISDEDMGGSAWS